MKAVALQMLHLWQDCNLPRVDFPFWDWVYLGPRKQMEPGTVRLPRLIARRLGVCDHGAQLHHRGGLTGARLFCGQGVGQTHVLRMRRNAGKRPIRLVWEINDYY